MVSAAGLARRLRRVVRSDCRCQTPEVTARPGLPRRHSTYPLGTTFICLNCNRKWVSRYAFVTGRMVWSPLRWHHFELRSMVRERGS